MGNERDVPGRLDIADLTQLVHAEPHRAAVLTEARLDAGEWADDDERAQLHWILGTAERERGRLDAAKTELERAVKLAKGGDPEFVSRIQSSLAFVVARQGDLDGAYDLLLAAEEEASPLQRARLLAQRGIVAHLRGELTGAADMLNSACEVLQRHGDHVNEARHRANLGAVLSELGRFTCADRHLRRAVNIAEWLRHDVVTGIARSTLGYVATLRGDLPGAIQEYTTAERAFERAAADSYLGKVHLDHAKALADAGLLDDAESLVSRALAMFREQGQGAELASGLLTAAEIRLARGDLDGVREAADEAAVALRAQHRHRWIAVAVSLSCQARARAGGEQPDDRLARILSRAAKALRQHGWRSHATRAELTAAKLRAESGTLNGEPLVDDETRSLVRGGRAADRILLAYIDAVTAEHQGDRAAARRAVSNGLRIARSAQSVLGTIETRAHATVHGRELTLLGRRLAIADDRPRELLARIEANRLMAALTPLVRPPDDHTVAALLVELRAIDVRLADQSMSARDRADAEQQRLSLERRLRRHARGVRCEPSDGASLDAELAEAMAMLGDRQLLVHTVVDRQLHAVTLCSRGTRLHDLGAIDGVRQRLDSIGFCFHRLSRTQGSAASRIAAIDLLDHTLRELSGQLVPTDVRMSDAPLVVVPSSWLHDVPWGMLWPLQGRPVSVNPSVTAWAKAERRRRERRQHRGGQLMAGFVAGPQLDHGDREVEQLSSLYQDATVLTGDSATVPACLQLLGAHDVVHIASHGAFRADNPMFSAVLLADGRLLVYDLERSPRLPEIVVLSACRAASAKALEGGALLGLAGALTALGAANVIAPLAPISDFSSVDVMRGVHEAIVRGAAPPEALAEATSKCGGVATAGSFVALGA